MLYSFCPAAMLVINSILNWELFRNYGFRAKKTEKQKLVWVRYNFFLFSVNGYFFVDMLWGLLYEHRDIPSLFPIIYSLTVFYFLFMLLIMLMWTRYIVAYLDKDGWSSRVLLYMVWGLSILGVLFLMLNRFLPFMFSYNEAHEFIGETGSNVSFLLQIAFYIVITAYMFYVSRNSIGRERVRYTTVAVTSMIMGIFLVVQIFYAFWPTYAIGLMLGICMIHAFAEFGEKKEKAIREHIASAMAEDYEAIFYIEIETGEYLTFSKSQKYMSIDPSSPGKNFFLEALDSIDICVYEDDREYAKSFYTKEAMLKNMEDRHSFSFKYRVLVDGEPRHFLFTVMRENSGQYFIFYEKDIEDELKAEKAQRENQKKSITFSQIAEALASNYDVIYYVDILDSSYVSFQANNIYGQLEVNQSGEDFFEESYANIPQVVFPMDISKVMEFLEKDRLITVMENHKVHSLDYRLWVDNKPQYTRMTVRKSSDGTHFIIGVENVNDEILREKQFHMALKNEKELARRDELTGVKNKTAYLELEESAQGNIDNGMDYLTFGLVVCDANNLKKINDTLGHAAGDEYIRASARLLCDIFVHSPVFRVGGDEFVVFLQGNDYAMRNELMGKLRSRVLDNLKSKTGVILASGMSEYKPECDNLVSDIFERADKEMYEEKQRLKALEA